MCPSIQVVLNHSLEYFIKRNNEERKIDRQYSDGNIKEMYSAYHSQTLIIRADLKKKRKQYYLWLYRHLINDESLSLCYILKPILISKNG
jgi:hypothetical protein